MKNYMTRKRLSIVELILSISIVLVWFKIV